MSGIPAAVAMAKAADTVVLAVGTDLGWSAEGHDAATINFTAASAALIEQVAAAAKKPITVVLLTATPLDISAMLANPKVGAVLHTGQPSGAPLAAQHVTARLGFHYCGGQLNPALTERCPLPNPGLSHDPRHLRAALRQRFPGREDHPDYLPGVVPGPDLDLRLWNAAGAVHVCPARLLLQRARLPPRHQPRPNLQVLHRESCRALWVWALVRDVPGRCWIGI